MRIAASTITNTVPFEIGSVSARRPGPTLKSASAKPMAITNDATIVQRPISAASFASSASSGLSTAAA